MKRAKLRDAQATKAVILSAAEELFAEYGYCGTSIRKISQKSGASGSLILFHFKDKKELYRAVKASIAERYYQFTPSPIEDAKDLYSILDNIMEAMFSYYKNNPTMMKLAHWATLEGDQTEWWGESDWHHRYMKQITMAQENNEIRKDVHPFRVLTIITGAIHMWWEYHEHLLGDLKQTNSPDNADEKYYKDLKAVLLKGLEPA